MDKKQKVMNCLRLEKKIANQSKNQKEKMASLSILPLIPIIPLMAIFGVTLTFTDWVILALTSIFLIWIAYWGYRTIVMKADPVYLIGLGLFTGGLFLMLMQVTLGLFVLSDYAAVLTFFLVVFSLLIAGANIIRNPVKWKLTGYRIMIMITFGLGIVIAFDQLGFLGAVLIGAEPYSLIMDFTETVANIQVLFNLLVWTPPIILLFDIALTAAAADDFDGADGLWIDLAGSIVYGIAAFLFSIVGFAPTFI